MNLTPAVVTLLVGVSPSDEGRRDGRGRRFNICRVSSLSYNEKKELMYPAMIYCGRQYTAFTITIVNVQLLVGLQHSSTLIHVVTLYSVIVLVNSRRM